MNYTLVVYMAIILNTFIAGLFPDQVGLSDPLGIESIRQQQFNNFDSNTQAYFVQQGVFNEDGTPAANFDTWEDLQTAGQQESGVIVTDLGFSFTDYFKIAWNGFISIGIFMIAFIVILFQLPLAIAIFIAPIISSLAIFAVVKFIIGR